MNVQKKRDFLKKDVRQVLSRRRDGIALADFWIEVSRELGYEIRGKDYMVPRLSYFFYLWGGDFKVTDDRVYLKDYDADNAVQVAMKVDDDNYVDDNGDDDDNALANRNVSGSSQYMSQGTSYTSQPYPSSSHNESSHQCRDDFSEASGQKSQRPTAMDLMKRTGQSSYDETQTFKNQRQKNTNSHEYYTSHTTYESQHYQSDNRYNEAEARPSRGQSIPPDQTGEYSLHLNQANSQTHNDSTHGYTYKDSSNVGNRNLNQVSQGTSAMDLLKRTGSEGQPRAVNKNEFYKSNYLTGKELEYLRGLILEVLENFQQGIKHTKLIKCSQLKNCRELEKAIQQWGSFLSFLKEQMCDVVLINERKMICLRRYVEMDNHWQEVIDLTEDGPSEEMDQHDDSEQGQDQRNWQAHQHMQRHFHHQDPFQQSRQQGPSQEHTIHGPSQTFTPQRNTQHSQQGPSQQQQGQSNQGFSPGVIQSNMPPKFQGSFGDFVQMDVKPIEKKEFEKQEVVVMPLNIPRNVQPSQDFIDSVARECIEMLAGANEFVMAERVEKMLFQRFQINHIRQIGVHHITNLPCIYELNRLLNKVHGYVISFIKTRPVCTLYELKDALKYFIGNIEDFSQLKIGPLQRSPVVFQHFKFPPDQSEIPEITSIDVLEHFRNYMHRENLWSTKPELEPFMNYLVEQYEADSAYYLGVRIISLPLVGWILKRAHQDSVRNKRQAFEYYSDLVRQEVEDAFRKFRACMLQTGEGDDMEVRRHYLRMRPDDVILEVFEKFNYLMTNTNMRETNRGHQRKMCRVIEDYINLIRSNPICRVMFHLSICMSYLTVEETVLGILNPKQESNNTDSSNKEPAREVQPPPRKDKLKDLIKTYIERCLNAGSLSLTHLDRIEEKLLEEFNFADFHLMGYGRFLQFLISDNKQVLDEAGGLVLGSGSVGGVHDSVFKPDQADIQEFIKQCKACGLTQANEIEDALCKHYGVKELRHLGYGNVGRLISHADKHKQGLYSDFTVFYQSTLTTPTGSSRQNLKVGVLGHQTKDLAKICLHNCPLLEDLAEWSQWSLVFEPELGKLKDFVQKYGGVTTKTLEGGRLATIDFLALETKPGVLSKIVSNTSPELIAEALERRDISSFCGHLVSMVISYKGVNNLPKALIAGHIKTALLQLHADEPSDTQGSILGHQNSACQFILDCLLRIPTDICVSVADDLFLSPLGQVVGSTKFKQILVQLCKKCNEINQLAKLGCLLGIQEWTNFVSEKCLLSEDSILKVTPDIEEFFPEEEQDQVKGSENDDDDEDDDESDDDVSDTDEIDEILEGGITASGSNQEPMVKEEEGTKVNVDEGKTGDEDDQKAALDKGKEDSYADEDVTMETNDDETNVTARTCEDIINEIRKDEFGVGVHLGEDGQRLMRVQQERLGRSLDRLSKDLYSKDTHFVLELVQNADDNSYHDDLLNNVNDVCPSVKFVIDDESVSVRNNELGFQEKDIRALCDVGRSTKGKHKFGYIGQKGIGFKSVFRVTDTPEIHSNGYHVQFDVNSGPMGYILPHWSPDINRVDENWKTNILLALKPEMKQQARTLAARFNDIHPSLLLFLHRLREIIIKNKVEGSIQTMRRRDVGDNIVEIQHNSGLDRWLVVKKMLDASKISLQAKSGAEVESTEIALAFPIRPAGQKLSMQRLPPKQLVFAFLPLRSYGFRFIVQGDFDVPSSREDVDRDSSWNQWLRNEIHTLFLDSLDMFKNHQDFTNIEAVVSYLQFVPMEDEILDFFKPVASDILKKLKARPCVPTQPNSQGVTSWKIPSQTVQVRDPLVRSVITPGLLQTHLNLYYLHPEVASMLNPTLTSCLGIETLTSEHLFQIGKALIVAMNGYCGSNDDIILISKWLACLYRSQDEFHDDHNIQTSLKALRMLPLSDGRLVSLDENTIFFPINRSDSNKEADSEGLHHLQNDVNSLHHLLLKTDDEEVNSQVNKLLTRLGVKQLSPFDMVNHHIIPVFKSDRWKEKADTTLVSYITYIKTQTDRQSSICNLEELKDCVQILTNKGIKSPKDFPVHFSSVYGGIVDLQQTFPGYEWTMVDPVYLPSQSNQMNVLGWHDFFLKIGVEDFFSIQKREVCLKKDQLSTSTWKDECGVWPKGAMEYIIQDYHCEELDSLVTCNLYPSGETYQNQMRALCVLLDKWWESKIQMYTRTQVCDKSGRILRETCTSFGILLQTSCWLPATESKCSREPDGSVSQFRNVEIRKPGGLYIHSDEVENLLADKVPYLDVNMITNSSFHQFLGLKSSVNIETVKEYLLTWCSRSEPDVPAVFCTSLKHMKKIYSYLGIKLNRGELQSLLMNNPVFFVPSKVSGSSELVSGKMLSRKEIWLADKTGLFDKHRGLLEEFHSEICKKRTINSFYSDTPELINIFKQEGKIDHQPQIEEYLELLSLLCTTSTPKDFSVLADVLYIFTIIGQALSHVPETADDKEAEKMLDSMKTKVKRKVQKEKVFPTKKGVWVSLNDKPMIADNKDWEKMFIEKEKVYFLDIEDKHKIGKSGQEKFGSGRLKVSDSKIQFNMIETFISICGVKKLSECVKTEVNPSITEACPSIQTHFHQIVPTVQQYLLARFKDVYHDLEQKNTKQMWKNATFLQTDKLEVIYKMTVIDKEMCEVRKERCVITPPTFYFHRDHVTSIPDINREIARYLSGGDIGCNTALRSFLSELHNIQSGLTSDTTEKLLQRHEAEGVVIPENEAWEVEPPEIEPGEIEEFPVDSSSGPMFEPRKESTGMRAWPPIAPVDGNKPKAVQDKVNAPTTTSTLWPPPQAKDYMKTVKDLPSNVRMAGPGEQVQEAQNVDKITKEKDVEDQNDGQGQIKINKQAEGQTDIHGSSGKNQVHSIEVNNGPAVSRKRKISETGDSQQDLSSKRMHGEITDNVDENGVNLIENIADNQLFSETESSIVMEDKEKTNSDEKQLSRNEPGQFPSTENKRLSNIKGAPVWAQGTTEYSLDQLATGLELPQSVHSLSFTEIEGDTDIGRWGESLVAEYLKQEKERGNILDFQWNNNEEETGAPYDFVVKVSHDEGTREDYIEVKSTSTDNKEMFEISVQQIKFAEEKKGCFHIYRVFNAGNPEKARLARLLDLNLRLSQKQKKKKSTKKDVQHLTLGEFCQQVQFLNIEDKMELPQSVQLKRAMLKKDIRHVLSKYPEGVRISNLSGLVLKETGREIKKQDYQISKLPKLLESWSEDFKILNDKVYLIQDNFEKSSNFAADFPLLGTSFGKKQDKQPSSSNVKSRAKGHGVNQGDLIKINDSSLTDEDEDDDSDISIIETKTFIANSGKQTNEKRRNDSAEQLLNPSRTNMASWGAPALQGNSKQKMDQLGGGKDKAPVPSFDFISFSDDDDDDDVGRGKKSKTPDVVDLTEESPGTSRQGNMPRGSSNLGMPSQPIMVRPQHFLIGQPIIRQMTPQPLMQIGLNPALIMNQGPRWQAQVQPGPSAMPQGQISPVTQRINTQNINENKTTVNHSPNLTEFKSDIVDLTIKQFERKDFESKEIIVHPVNIPRNRPPPRDFVDNIAKECIELLADANEFVLPERIDKLVCQRFQINHVRQIGFNHVTNIPCVYELNRLLSKIHAYVFAFIKTRSFCTLYELKEALREYVPNKEDFSKLKVGPLQRSPVVFEQFKFPPDQAEIPKITSIDVLEHFRNYLTKKNLWTTKLTLEPFMDYLVEEYNVDSAYFLGVRIMSLPLAAAVLKKAQRDAGSSRRGVYEHYKEQLQTEVEDAFRKFRAVMLQTGDEDGMVVRRHYLKMRPDLVVMEIFEKYNLLMAISQMGETTRGHQKRITKAINDFVEMVRTDNLGKSLFHLAICMSSMDIEEATLALLTPSRDEKEKSPSDEESKESKPPPRKDKLIEFVKTYIERCLNAGSLSLTHLDRIEEKLLEEFGFADFHLMGYGRFLQFLISESKTKQTLEEGGGLVLGSSSSSEKDSMFKPHQADIQEFIKQCKLCGLSQSGEIEDALCRHYCVKEVRHLGYGNISRLMSLADKQRLGSYSDFTVFYQSTLTRPSGISQSSTQKVGVLGHQTKDLAKICLHNCPLLEDLAEWSQWSLVFEPELGKLKDFVQKYGGVTNKTLEGGKLATLDFLALETKPGVLLKIVSNTSPEHIAQALERRDIFSFCGHLVSMVIAYKGVSNLPKALIAGHIKTALLQLHAVDPRNDTPGAPSTFMHQNSASQFVLQCLLRLPTRICVDLADDLLLSPLGQVVGSTKFKQVLVQLCGTVQEMNHLTELGCLLGIQEWTNLIPQKCVLPESSIQKITPDEEELFEEEQQEQEEDEDSSEDSDDEDLEEILAGDPKSEPVASTSKDTASKIDKNDLEKVIDEVEIMELGKQSEVAVVDLDEDSGDVKIIEATDVDVIVTEDGSETEKLKVNIRTCEDVINEIRKDEFGVGVHLSEDGQRLMRVQQQRLGRSLDRLSKDLYSKDTHFVLELVQNADDNSYHDDLLNNVNDVCPSVKFVIDDESVSVRNNELGFQEKDVRALCDVGRSTKGKHKFGYIGQKGIGFKSVFRVTDTPEIHSNGYHIKFDVNSGPMGYILPHWSPDVYRVDEKWTTNIILTLKADMRLQTRTLAARFNDIHPSLLLFLHRLREITIENRVENSIQAMRRRDVGDNIIEIEHTGGLDRWLVLKKMLDASKISSQAKSGADVESTEIALAFPIKPQGQKSKVQALPPKQLVFAFLPLRSYGFRFIVQGDFDVPSSREDVDRDSSWNQWLRNEIHTLFLDSLDMFKNHQDFTNIEAVITFLQFVPMEDEVLDFFKPVASDILKKLKARPCVPTQPNNQGSISWKIPSQTVRVRDPLVRSVITPELLQAHLNLHYLHQDVASMLNPTLTSCLGIETLTSEHLFHLGKALIVQMGEYADQENVLLIARWLACMYRSLDEFQDDDTILSTLKSLQMLPLSDGKLVSLQEETVFYPIPNSDSNVHRGRDPLYYLQQDVNSLHPLLLKTEDSEVNSQVHKLLLRLGIKQLSPFDVINHHIIPVLKSDVWKRKSKETIISYIIYIKEQTEKQKNVCNLEELRDIAQLFTNKGIKNPSTEPVHFSHHFGNTINLQLTFSGYEWTVVDQVYLPQNSSQMTVLSWHDFFLKLGVEDCFSIQKREVCLRKDQLPTSIWKGVYDLWPLEEEGYVIQDWYSEELESLMTNNKYPSGEKYQDQMRALCQCMEKLWDNKFSRYTKTNVCDKNGQILKETETSFSILLRTCSWLPALVWTCKGGPDGSVDVKRNIEMRESSGLYNYSEKLDSIMSNKVPYLDVKLALNTSFHQFLGLKNSVTVETVKESLLQWCARSDANVPAVFCTSLSHMKNVYDYLGRQLNRGDLQSLLIDNPVFFVPSKISEPDEIISGKMISRNEVWLADKTGLFDKHRSLLEEFHSDICKKRTINSFYCDTPELINIFKQDGKIDKQPKIEEYIELLSLLCTTCTPKDLMVLSDVLHIFTVIGQTLSDVPDAPDEKTADMILESMKSKVKKQIQKEKVLPTKKGVWVSLNDKPMIADNKDWEKMFADKEKVHFLDFGDKVGQNKQRKSVKQRRFRGQENPIQQDMINVFIEVCGIQKLSDCVKPEVVPEMIQQCPKLQGYFHDIVPIMQLYLLSKHEDVYRDLEQKNTRQMLRDANFYQTKDLEVIYRLIVTDTFERRKEKCVIAPPTFYFHQDHINSIPEVNKEIARQFSEGNNACNNSLRGFLLELHTILSGPDDNDSVDALLQRHDVELIDISEDEAWQVEPPPLPEPEPEAEPEPEPLEDFPLQPSSDNRQSGSGKEEPFVMRAWPPVASENSNKTREKSSLPESNIWPPPQAKDYMRTLKDLPSNFRMAGPSDQKSESDQNVNEFPKSGEGVTGSSLTFLRTLPGPSGDGQGHLPGYGNEGQGHQAGSGSEGQGPPGNHGNGVVSEGAGMFEGSTADINRKRKLSDDKNNDDPKDVKRHSTEYKGVVINDDQAGRDPQNSGRPASGSQGGHESRGPMEGDRSHGHSNNSGVAPIHHSPVRQTMSPQRHPQSPEKQQSSIKGDPIWTRMATEYMYDELGCGAELPSTMTLTSGEGDPEVGRWGENLVACYLQKQKEAGNIVDFQWNNHQNETGSPYDFLVHFADENGMHEDFIEVKSTVSEDKDIFEISVQQIKFAEEKRGNFHIYRVFNAGNPEKVRLIRIFDLDLRLSQKQVKLCMLI